MRLQYPLHVTYAEALAYIEGLQGRGWRLGLDRMEAFVRAAGLEGAVGGVEGGPRFIHVAGTNGKGSVTAFLQSILVEQRWRVGAFFSPYVVDPRERVQLGREMIKPHELALLTNELRGYCEALTETQFGGATEFEFKTALGFAYWKRKACEWVALEVGLGGRLDATNVVRPAATVIVSIGWDHMAILGETLEKIASEKAGIIKPGVPLILGAVPDRGARQAILEAAKALDAPVLELGREIQVKADDDGRFTICLGKTSEASAGRPKTFSGLRSGLFGSKQASNAALAVAAVEAAGALRAPDRVALGVERASAPGRFQRCVYRGADFILDGAHNADAAHVLAESLRLAGFGDHTLTLLTGMLEGHEAKSFYHELKRMVKDARIVPIDFHRSRKSKELAQEIAPLFPLVRSSDSLEEALEAAARGGRPVLVTGSFYLVGEVLRLLKRGGGIKSGT